MNKILVIGQALPRQKQEIPYDTTLLYDMLDWAGVSKKLAQDLFDFDALADVFPGLENSSHKPPTKEMIAAHEPVLIDKIMKSRSIILLGKMAIEEYGRCYFFEVAPCRIDNDKNCLCLPHPSRRNYNLIMKNKEIITQLLNEFLND